MQSRADGRALQGLWRSEQGQEVRVRVARPYGALPAAGELRVRGAAESSAERQDPTSAGALRCQAEPRRKGQGKGEKSRRRLGLLLRGGRGGHGGGSDSGCLLKASLDSPGRGRVRGREEPRVTVGFEPQQEGGISGCLMAEAARAAVWGGGRGVGLGCVKV